MPAGAFAVLGRRGDDAVLFEPVVGTLGDGLMILAVDQLDLVHAFAGHGIAEVLDGLEHQSHVLVGVDQQGPDNDLLIWGQMASADEIDGFGVGHAEALKGFHAGLNGVQGFAQLLVHAECQCFL